MSFRSSEKRGPLALESWARNLVDGYKNCTIKNMTTSWRNGLAFCALIHRFRPDLIDYDELDPDDIIGNCTLAFDVAERELGIPPLLDPVDMAKMEVPDRLSVLTYVAQFYYAYKNMNMKPKSKSSSVNSSSRSSPILEAKKSYQHKVLLRNSSPDVEGSLSTTGSGSSSNMAEESKSTDSFQSASDKGSKESLEREPSDILVLKPNSSLVSQIKQSEEEEIVKRNTAANAANQNVTKVDSKPNSRRNSTTVAAEIKSTTEMPNIYSVSNLPIVQRIERAAAANIKLQDKEHETSEKGESVDEKIENIKPELHVRIETHSPSPPKDDTPVESLSLKGESRTQSPVPSPSRRRKNKSPVPSPSPRRKHSSPGPSPSPAPRRNRSPVPSTASTDSTMSLNETSASAPSPMARRTKVKPPRPVPPSQASLISLKNRGSVPSAKEIWKKDNYYPAELNPFESEEDITVTPTTSKPVPKNPFEEDEEDAAEEEQQPNEPSPRSSPKSSPKVKSARGQVNCISKARSRSGSRSPSPSRSRSKSPLTRARSPSRSRSRSKSPVTPVREPQPKPRTPQSAAVVAPVAKKTLEPKPYNPFEDDDDEEGNAVEVGGADESNVSLRQKDNETSSATSSINSTPVPTVRHSFSPSVTSSPGGTVKKSSKSRRAPLPPTFTSPESSQVVQPVSPKPILKNSNLESPKKVIPVSPDLLKGLKSSRPYKKKRRAPPPRRKVEPLPKEAIKVEMGDLSIKRSELERQAAALETIIRQRMEEQSEQPEKENVDANSVVEDKTSHAENEAEGETKEASIGSSAEKQQLLDDMMVQLFSIVNEKNEILRRQTELEYLQRSHGLEEMQAELEFKLRVLMDTPIEERKDNHAQVEQTLLDEMLKVVDERNDVVEWLDSYRKQDQEEEELMSSRLSSYSNSSSLQRQSLNTTTNNQQQQPVALIKDSTDSSKEKPKKKDKEKKSKDKSEKKSKLKLPFFGKKGKTKNKDGQDQKEVNGTGTTTADNDDDAETTPSNANANGHSNRNSLKNKEVTDATSLAINKLIL